jgi:hypothetical protein
MPHPSRWRRAAPTLFTSARFSTGAPPIRLAAAQLAAAAAEIDRLKHVCKAVETAPQHDRDKALRPSAAAWERLPLRGGWWPAEKRVPVLSSESAVRDYDEECQNSQDLRRGRGKPFWDFECTVFTVPERDGRFRLCTDYRPLNDFQTKWPFKMENVQTVAETIQPGDFGMLVDLTDCYLTMGLPPAQVLPFPVSSGRSARRLVGLFKQLGIRCIIYIDDRLILHKDRTRLARGMAIAMDLL